MRESRLGRADRRAGSGTMCWGGRWSIQYRERSEQIRRYRGRRRFHCRLNCDSPFMKMLSKGLVPTDVTYRIVIHRYCQLGRVEDLLKLLEKLLSRQKCRTAYNQVIEKLCSFGYLEEADKILGMVLRTASKVDASTCHVLMESYLSKGIPLLAYKVACRMFNRNLIPDLKLCEKVSKRLTLEGKSEEADNLMLRFVERGHIQPQSGHIQPQSESIYRDKRLF